MKLWKRILSCFLALLLTVYLLPVQVMAEELGDLWPLTTENIAETPPDVIGEVLERRGENQKEFLLANGVRQVVIYPAAVHYQKDGQWEDIDNRLLPATTRDGETVYQNVAGMWDVSVPAELNTAGGITVSRNGYSLSFYLTGQLFEDGGAISESGSASMGEELPCEDLICVSAGESTAAISSTTSTLADDDQLQPEAALKNQRSEAVYQNVYHDTDVTYDLDSNRLKESLILRSCPKEMLGYRYRLETDSLRLELQEDNRILAYAKDAGPQDEPVFYMPAPYLLDAENAYSNDIKVTLEENDKAVALGISHKAGHVLVFDGENSQLLAAAQHGGKPLASFDFVLVPVFQCCVQKRRHLLCRTAGDFCRNLHALQAQSDDLFSCVSGCVHAVVPPFVVVFVRPPGQLSVSPPSRRSARQYRRTDALPGAAL